MVNPVSHVGGMVSGGLGVTDAGRVATIGGFAGEFFTKLGAHYGQKGPMFRHEPGVAEKVLNSMLKDAGVAEIKAAPLAEGKSVLMDGPRITEILLENGRKVAAQVYIDTSYEGDLMAKAGVSYIVGREGRETYGEDLAGVRTLIRHGEPSMARDDAGLLPDIHEGETGRAGEGDSRIMSYNFRLCLTKDKSNQVAVPRPEEYDPRRYTLLSRVVLSQPKATLRSVFSIGQVPGGKTDFNNIGPISSNLLNASWAYPEASPDERKKIWASHRNYLQGLLYFLQNDPAVPGHIQKEAREWGLARDEFVDTGHWPNQLYVREARRMIGEKVMTQHDLQKEPRQPDSIGMGSYMMDSHYIQRTVTPEGLFSEGTLGGDHRVVPYEISYRSLLPKRIECTNLLVPVCLSASHVAYSSLRMEPVYMILGHAAGTAAAMAVKSNGTVQDVDSASLREKLTQEAQVLSYEIAGKIDRSSLDGIVQDEGDAVLKGAWLKSTSGEPFVGVGYIHDNNTDKGRRIATYTLPVPTAGDYEVRLYYAVGSNRATNARVTITAANGVHQLSVNQKEALPEDVWHRSLGVFPFEEKAVVEISNEGTDGVVVADAVQLLPASEAKIRTNADPRPATEQLADQILTLQLPDGALRFSAVSDTVRVVPYFGNIAAMGLLATGDARYHEPVRRWIEWYVRHQEDDGTIYDFVGTVQNYKKSDHRDSTDSYAATFLQVLSRYVQAKGLDALTPAMREGAGKALAAIKLSLDHDGLTWAKPEYKAKYLMDNLEVCQGLNEAARLFEEMGEPQDAAEAEKILQGCIKALKTYWQPERGHFAWAKGSSGAFQVKFERWYPDGIVHLFAMSALETPPMGLWEKLHAQFGAEPRLTPDWWLRASHAAGTDEEREKYRALAEDFARSLAQPKGQLNRMGTTLLGLAEKERSTVDLGRLE